MRACVSGATCNFACPEGGCHFSCASDSTCTATCAGGGCTFGCATGASCQLACAGGGCTYNCAQGSACSMPGQPTSEPATAAPASATCDGVCAACYQAVVAGCQQCPSDRDCDSAEEPCLTARTIEQQFGCDACASGLGLEAATDDCR